MFKLENKETEIHLEVEGYAYPYSRDYWDSNWLSIGIKIYIHSDLYYDNNDVCLLTTELVDLENWFKTIQRKEFQEDSQIEFTEPCISFTINRNNLIIKLKYNLNPKYQNDFDSTYEMKFELNNTIFENIIKSLQNNIRKFPERNIDKITTV